MARSQPNARKHAKGNPCGKLSVTRGGFGFVDTPEGEYFIPASKMTGAFDGDIVEIIPVNVNQDYRQPHKKHNVRGRKPTARVARVTARAHETLVGRYEVVEPFGIVIPENERIKHDIFTMHSEHPEICDGDIVKVRITQFPTNRESAMGTIERVIGHAGIKGVEIEAIIADHDLETEFSSEALAQAKGARVDEEGALAAGYVDLRDRFIFTIDPVDARDFDDALSLDRVDNGWRLGVHIADVSHYVTRESPMDREARRRATSVYLVDRVIPMLPEDISNDVCSLAPNQARRVMTVDMVLSDAGDVVDCSYYPSLITSKRRLDYGRVQQMLDEGCDDAELAARLPQLKTLTKALERQRQREGSLDLDTTEAHVILNDDGDPVEVVLRKRTDATSLVEQAMILANTCVARYLDEHDFPCIYRVHDAPSPDALALLVPILHEFGYSSQVDIDEFTAGNSAALQAVLKLSKDRPEQELFSMLLLRSLKRAEYRPYCDFHFGLAIPQYAHFTSPIRRYPDLVVHRMLKACLFGLTEDVTQLCNALPAIAEHSSAMERVTDDAAQESQTVKLVEYLEQSIGETFSAIISKVASYGFFVRLDNTAVGLVALGEAGHEPFALDMEHQTLIGQESGKVFRLGQRVLVRLVAANTANRHLDFTLVSGTV